MGHSSGHETSREVCWMFGGKCLPAFLIKGTRMAGASFLQQPFCHHEENNSASPDRHQLLKATPATTHLQTSC